MNPFDRGLPLNDDDCVEFENKTAIRISALKSLTIELVKKIHSKHWEEKLGFPESFYAYNYSEKFFEKGISSEVLQANASGWKKGKIRIRVSVEFYPDESEAIDPPASPLDDIRQNMS
jgi:hypothetical protein